MSTSEQTTTAPEARPNSQVRYAGMSEETREALASVLCLETQKTRADILDAAIRNAVSELGALMAPDPAIYLSAGIDVVTIVEGVAARLHAACDLGDWAEAEVSK